MKKLLGALAAILTLAAMPAAAANCSAYPFTLSNGTTADATQVMSDLNLILNCANNNLAHNGANGDITSLTSVTLNGTTTAVGALLFSPDATYSIGAVSATRPLNLYASGSLNSATVNISGLLSGQAATFTGEVTTTAPTTAGAGLNLPPGAAPTSPVNGDMWTTSTGVFAQIAGATVGPLGGASYLEVQNKQAQGTANPESLGTANAWNHRTLNAITNNSVGATLTSNQITLPAGTYMVQVTGTPWIINSSSLTGMNRLFDYTASTVLVNQNAWQPSLANSPFNISFSGIFTISGTHAVGLDIYYTGGLMTGNGAALNLSGFSEIYTDVIITKLK